MQVSNHFSSVRPNKSSNDPLLSKDKNSSSPGDASVDYDGLSDYASVDNPIFQNLLKNPAVQQDVTLNDDGTYSWNYNAKDGSSISQQFLAKMLVEQQNGYQFNDPNAQTQYSESELANFRKITGYNLIQAGGGYTLADDEGNPPPADQMDMVNAAWNSFDLAKGLQDMKGDTGDLTGDDLDGAVDLLASQKGANVNLYDELMNMIEGILPSGSTDDPSTGNDPANGDPA